MTDDWGGDLFTVRLRGVQPLYQQCIIEAVHHWSFMGSALYGQSIIGVVHHLGHLLRWREFLEAVHHWALQPVVKEEKKALAWKSCGFYLADVSAPI